MVSSKSAKALTQSGKLDDIYVIIDPGAKFTDFGNKAKQSFEAKFKKANMNAEVVVLTGLEMKVDTSGHGHKYLLTVQLTSGGLQNGEQRSGVYDISVFDVSTEDRIWRAEVSLDGMNNLLFAGSNADDLANETIKDLIKDGLM
jgi:hypothetical protein